MISDGGQKIDRAVCAQKFSMLKKNKHTEKYVLTGCTRTPSSKNAFCSEHQSAETPVILAEQLTSQNRKKLRAYRENSGTNKSDLKDSVYIVEKVFDKKNNNYLIKFNSFPESEACWEPGTHLSDFIKSFYKKKTNLKKILPSPKLGPQIIKGNEIYFEVDWTGKTGTHFELQDGQSIFDLDADKLCDDVLKSTCNTRKNKDKRCRRHTAGIFISARPCGIIPHVDEMHGSETINQTYGSILDYYGELSDEERANIKCWMYDDMCHLKVIV